MIESRAIHNFIENVVILGKSHFYRCMRRIFVAFICLIGLSNICEAQKSTIDSLYAVYDTYEEKVEAPDSLIYQIISLTIRTKIERIEPYLQELVEISVQKDSFFIQKVNYATAHLLKKKREFNEAEILFINYIDFFERQDPPQYPCDAYYYLGQLLISKKSFNKAAYYFIRGRDQAIKKHPEWIPLMVTALGEVYRRLEYFDEAIESYQLVLENKDIKPQYKMRANMFIADTYFESGKVDSARVYANKLIKLSENSVQIHFFNRGKLLIAQADFESGYYRKTIDKCNEVLDAFPLSSLNVYAVFQVRKLLGYAHSKLGEYKEAQVYYKEYYQISRKRKNLKNQRIALLGLIECYQELNKKDNLIDAYKSLEVVQESINERTREEKLLDLSAEYELELKSNELKLVESKNKIIELEKKTAQRYNIIAIVGLVVLAIFSLLLFRALSNQRKAKKALSESLADKELLLKEIHHRVKNNLQVVSSLLGLQSEYIKDESALSAINEGRNRVRSMSLIHQNLYKENNLKGISMKSYLEKLISGLFETYNINEDKVKLSLTIQDLDLDVDTVVPLGLITNELVSNALKHAFKIKKEGTISVSLQEKEDILELIVKDNGDGLESSKINEDIESFGYQMIFAFKEKLNADLDIINSHGTSVKLSITEYQKT